MEAKVEVINISKIEVDHPYNLKILRDTQMTILVRTSQRHRKKIYQRTMKQLLRLERSSVKFSTFHTNWQGINQ